jgi:anaerobic ribonucleoside-triphosphate reductase activating protein
VRAYAPGRSIWLWTGYLWEDVADDLIGSGIDVVVDGQFMEELKDLRLKYRGSSNQRVIDVCKSTKDSIVLYE